MTTTHEAEGNGLIEIQRKAVPWRDRVRAYRVLIDGEAVGKIGDGDTAEFEVSPGRHTVRLGIAWTGSPEVVVDVQPAAPTVLIASARSAALVIPDLITSPFRRNAWIQFRAG